MVDKNWLHLNGQEKEKKTDNSASAAAEAKTSSTSKVQCYSCGERGTHSHLSSCNTEKGEVLTCPDRLNDACVNFTFVGKTKDGKPFNTVVRTCGALWPNDVFTEGCRTRQDEWKSGSQTGFGNETYCACKGDLCNMVGLI